MTIEEIKAKFPEGDFYELRPDCRYLMIVDPRYAETDIAIKTVIYIKSQLDIKIALVMIEDPDETLKLIELKP